MLKTLFIWLDHHPTSYWAIVCIPTVGLLALAVVAAWQETRGRSAPPERIWLTPVLLLVVLFAWRWPYLLSAAEYNPVESQFIAGAITLMHDPVFWRSVDGMSAGPLNFYVLLPLHWLGLPLDYFSARLTGLLLVWGGLLACHATLRARYGPTAARLGVLPAAVFFCLVHEWDFISYSSELLPLALTALAAALILSPGHWRTQFLFAGSFVAGLLPWAKLQATPLGLALVAWAGWCVLQSQPGLFDRRRWRGLVSLLAAAALPSLVIGVLVLVTGQFETFVHTYLLQNLFYFSSAHGQALSMMIAAARETYLLPLFILTQATAVAMLFMFRWRHRPDLPFTMGATLTAVAVVCVLLPQRGFLHYTLLMIVPLTLWGGAAVGRFWQSPDTAGKRHTLGLLLLYMGAAVPIIVRGLSGAPEMFGRFAAHWSHPRSAAGNVLHAFARPGDRLAVWGWSARLYVETGLPQSTNVGYSYWSIVPSPLLEYNRARFLADIQRNEPAFFIDAVGPEGFYFQNRPAEAHEIFPALRDHVRQHYTQLVDLGSARIYCRRDRVAAVRQRWAELPGLIARGREDAPPPLPVEPFPPNDLPGRIIEGESVRMMLPPAKITWPLAGTERELIFAYGYDPVAYAQLTGNGTEFIVELLSPGQPPFPLFQQLLDPAHHPAQRGRQRARVLLPPLPKDAQLVLRTTPGLFNDNAWDWGYVTSVQFRRHPDYIFSQFPGFNRLPAAVDAGTPYLSATEGTTRLMLHAPGTLTYVLNGGEQQLSFAYGFQPGAYSDGGQTDGAIYRVELQRGEAPPRIIFERHLQPLSHEADRGRQQAEVPLPRDLHDGDRLVLKIDPGGSNSWDWTYVSDFFLN